MEKIRIIIADDHKMLRKAWSLLISKHENVTVIGEASNGAEVLDIISVNPADIILMDIDMPLMNGFETAKVIKEKYPAVKIIVLTMYLESSYIRKMMSLGVDGYLTKNSSDEELFAAIETVKDNGKYMSAEVSKIMEESRNVTEPEKLTAREKEIIQLVVQGLSSKEISDKLSLSIKTVESHRWNIYKKLDVKNVAELIQYVKENLLF